MTDILDLKGWKALSNNQSSGERVIEAEYSRFGGCLYFDPVELTLLALPCPACYIGAAVHSHGACLLDC